jgi:hypothetical protein
MMRQGVDYDEKHASTVKWNSVKMLIAIAEKFDLDIVLYDIKIFFLYGDLEIPVYMEIPEGWHDGPLPKGLDWVYEVMKGMYGFPQTANKTQKKPREALVKDGAIKNNR